MQPVPSQTFRAASRARDLAAAHYLFNPRVTLIDVGWRIKEGEMTEELAVRIHVRYKPREAVFESFAASNPELVIDKNRIPFPTVDFVESIYPLHWPTHSAQPSARDRVFSPLQGGVSIANEWSFYSYGTLGGIVADRLTGEKLILSNWHVLAESAYAPRGLRIYQPAYVDGGRFWHTIARLERDVMNQGVDAAVAKLTGDRPWLNEELDIGPVSGAAMPVLGMQVVKSGRGSGVTVGTIDGVEGEYPIYYGGLWRKIKYVQRIVPVAGHNEVSRGGDSGSWWLEEATKKAVALHFAGYDDPETALAMAMPPVLVALNVEIAPAVEQVERARTAWAQPLAAVKV